MHYFYGGLKHCTTKFFSLSSLGFGTQEFNSREINLHLTFEGTGSNHKNFEKMGNVFIVMYLLLSLSSLVRLPINSHAQEGMV